MRRWYVGLAIAVVWSTAFFIGLGHLGIGQGFFGVDLRFLLLAPSYVVLCVFSGHSRTSNMLFLLLSTLLFFVSGFLLNSQFSSGIESVTMGAGALVKLTVVLAINFCALIVMTRQGRARQRAKKRAEKREC